LLLYTFEGDGLVVIAVTSSAFSGFVTEKMKLPPSGPIGSHVAQNAADGKISRQRKTTGTKTVKGIL
jgi:hypothetical protein